MSGELIERLHDHARNVGGDPSFDRLGGSEACEIADEITCLRAELSSLRGEGGWVSYRVERAHYLDEGNAAVLCDRLPSPVTLVLKNPVRCEGDYFPWDFRDELPASLADRGGTSAAHSDVIGRLVGALAVGQKFVSACFSAWAAGEPHHRVKAMLDGADEFRAILDSEPVRQALASLPRAVAKDS